MTAPSNSNIYKSQLYTINTRLSTFPNSLFIMSHYQSTNFRKFTKAVSWACTIYTGSFFRTKINELN